jgi:CRISPR type III-B/RAMP module RAMP protein Cmr6
MIIGFGASNVLEAGLTLNPIYGAPLIPGSALKGLAAHYCSKVWGESDGKFKGPVRNARGIITASAGEHYQLIFGATEDAGFITFHDAWVTPSSLNGSLAREVITPHHQDYYMSQKVRSAPTDFDDPVPVTFLAVRGEFEIRVKCCDGGDKGKSWEGLTLELLGQALENWGVGGKTSSGYGRGELSRPSGAGSAANAVPASVSKLASLLAPGQKIEARVASVNKKGNPQFDAVFHDGEEIKISGRWDGTKREWKKGGSANVTVKGYSQNDNPPLVLTD